MYTLDTASQQQEFNKQLTFDTTNETECDTILYYLPCPKNIQIGDLARVCQVGGIGSAIFE